MTDLEALVASLRGKAMEVAKAHPERAPAPAAEAAPAAAETPAAAAPAEAPKADAAPAAAEAPAAAAPAAVEAAAADAPKGDYEGGDFGKAQAIEAFDKDGNPIPAIDGLALIKSVRDEFVAGLDALRAEFAAAIAAVPAPAAAAVSEEVTKGFTDQVTVVGAQAGELAKALSLALDAVAAEQTARAAQDARIAAQETALGQQGEIIKSMTDALQRYGAAGVGRVSAVTALDRPSPLAKAQPGQTVEQVFAKAEALNKEGKLNAVDVSRICARVNHGLGVPDEFRALFAA